MSMNFNDLTDTNTKEHHSICSQYLTWQAGRDGKMWARQIILFENFSNGRGIFCKTLFFHIYNIEKGRQPCIHYIFVVNVDATIKFPSPNHFLHSLFSSSSPALTNYFASFLFLKYFPPIPSLFSFERGKYFPFFLFQCRSFSLQVLSPKYILKPGW